ncbi:MAG: beta-propeller fold lactonase family protein [Balneolaceae bacterium]|nr:beta-propeller fold lactonase family protein [Balneolaceae bacterium]
MKNSWIGLLIVLLIVSVVGLGASEKQSNGDFILILNKSGNTAWQLEAESGEVVARYPTGNAPHEVAVSPDRSRAVITNYGDQRPGYSLTVIDLQQQKVSKSIDLEPYGRPHGVQWFSDNRRVVVSVEEKQAVAVVDIDSGKIVKTIKTNERVSHMVELDADQDRVFVPNLGSGTLSVLDLKKGTVIRTLKTGQGTEGITLAADRNELWVTNRESDTVMIIDTESLDIKHTLKSSEFPIRAEISPDGHWVAVSNARSSEVSIFGTESKEQVAKVSTEPQAQISGVPIGLTFSSDNQRLFVANSQANQIVVIDTSRWRVIDRFKTGETPDGIAYFTLP